MTDRLSAQDAATLYLEDSGTPMHVGSVMIFAPGESDFNLERLLALVTSRIAYVPRYRQRVRSVPGGLANPVWVDDAEFDLSYHVRRSALPRPGTTTQLEEFAARTLARPLDRHRPLWELYLVEGLADGQFAIITKSHQILVDGVHAIDLAQVIVDAAADRGDPVPHTWSADREPSGVELMAGAALDAVRQPTQVVDSLRSGSQDVRRVAGAVKKVGVLALNTVARTAARPAPSSPLNVEIGPHRRVLMLSTSLKDYQAIRTRVNSSRGGLDVSVHDVMLAVIAGGLRNWLLNRGEAVSGAESVRAMVPVSTLTHEDPDEQVAGLVIDLPVGEPRPTMRLHQVAYAMHQQMESSAGGVVTASSLREIAGFAPPTLHLLGARVGSAMSRRMFNLVVTNVPGPQQPLYVGDARMVASFPVIPLSKSRALSIGLTSYDGGVYFGLNADRSAMPDLDVLAQCLSDALAELAEDEEL
ncbi:WS/DGAT/MGAT family O-acyltransferase [Demetria terragena]|uniref:WS/DGAT/MGAT family O-acyltransferase n=1 Tax=Demetria terragena TaxID=63959 RepID=UPI000374C03C|nr:wax ester/triacylglycerol synthase family O-acyltransferase [Demetria terragena]